MLTVSFSAIAGLIGTSVYNIISSNIINVIQYISSILLNNNQRLLKNKAITIDIVIVLFTILIPIGLQIFHINFTILLVPIFIILFTIFFCINIKVHKLYLKEIDKKIEEEIIKEEKNIKNRKKVIIKYLIYLIIIGILLFFIGNALSHNLEKLANYFNIPEFILGIVLGLITSIPELITFFESQRHYRTKSKLEESYFKYNSKEFRLNMIEERQNVIKGVVEATNNLLSSNLLNLFFIQSVGIIFFSIFGK